MSLGLSFEEFVELKVMPTRHADGAFRLAAEQRRDRMFPMDLRSAASHLRSRGYDCRAESLELLLAEGIVSLDDPDQWTVEAVDAAASHFEECGLFVPYATMCMAMGCTYGDFHRALREAAERESEKYGRHVRADDQLFVLHRFPPRGGELVDGEFVGGHRALISFTLADDVRQRLERGEEV